MKQLQGRIALITGASRGIGAAVAKRFAKEGAHVILLARTVGGLEEVDDEIQSAGGTATLVPIDLLDADKIDQTAAALYERFKRLDVLVGNAAMLGNLSPIGHVAPKLWDDVLSLNLTANYRLIRAFDPLLRQSAAGRAVFVTAKSDARPYWGAYTVTKAGLESLVQTYAQEIAKSNVKANLIDPGIARTALRAHAYPGEDETALPHPDTVTDLFVELASVDCQRNGARLTI